MKQENNSTFSEGLVSDLNELSTPNNLLTDCINGTLVTFDGNEFSLQNDMGNAKVLIPGTYQYVKLKENFYPIGVKEYGGVLYIVSAKKPSAPAEYDDQKVDYTAGTFVKDSYGLFYYKCLQQLIVSHPLPTKTNEYWELIGSLEDYNNYLGEVEIGSFPYPEFNAAVSNESVLNSVVIDSLLYKQTIINDEIFKSGRYISFNDDQFANSTLFSYCSYDPDTDTIVNVPVLYKLKLWHQLTNGFYDLTSDIWEQYNEHKHGDISGKFWINEPLFRYYCPYQYKGKLAVSIEIEPSEFEFIGIPEVTAVYTNGILTSYTIDITTKQTTVGHIAFDHVDIKIYDDNDVIVTPINPVSTTVVNEYIKYTIELSASNYQDKLIHFELTPIFSTDLGNNITFPEIYTNSYIIETSVYLEKGWSTLIVPVENMYVCDYTTKIAYNTKYMLVNTHGQWVDVSGNPSDIKYVLIADTTDPLTYSQSYINNSSSSYTERIVATYKYGTLENLNKPETIYSNTNYLGSELDMILSNFEAMIVANEDVERCGTASLRINLNHPLEISYSEGERVDDQIVVSQGNIIYPATYSVSDLTKFNYSIDITKPYTVNINTVYPYSSAVSVNPLYFEDNLNQGLIKPFYPINYDSVVAPNTPTVTNNFMLISRLEGDYGIVRAANGEIPELQMIGFHFNTFLYSGYVNPEKITGNNSPVFSIKYNNGTDNILLTNKTAKWIPTEEQNNFQSFLEYRFRESNLTDVDYILSDHNEDYCISITSAGGDNNKLLSDSFYDSFLADNITDRDKYYVVSTAYYDNNSALKVKDYVFAKNYTLGSSIKIDMLDTTTSRYTIAEPVLGEQTDFVGNPSFIRKRYNDYVNIDISGESEITENTFATYSVAFGTFNGVLEWSTSDTLTIIEYPTLTSVKIRANDITSQDLTIPAYIMVLDSLGNKGYIDITINNVV